MKRTNVYAIQCQHRVEDVSNRLCEHDKKIKSLVLQRYSNGKKVGALHATVSILFLVFGISQIRSFDRSYSTEYSSYVFIIRMYYSRALKLL
jgi:hypothetical protein